MWIKRAFARASSAVAKAAGSAVTFVLCCLVIVAWAATGPYFHYSDTWQLIINTGTTIVTFLMVFLIQNTQNRDGAAIQAKLDELIRASKASNAFIGIEDLTSEEVEEFRQMCLNAKTKAAQKTAERAVKRVNQKAADAAADAAV